MIILQINSFKIYLKRYSETLSLLFIFFKLQEFYRTPLFVLAKYRYGRNLSTWWKSQYSPMNKVNMAMLLIIDVSRNVQFMFFYITWTNFRVSFANELSKSQVNIPLYKHNVHASNICLLVQGDFFVIFSTFKQHFQFLANKVSCLDTLKFVEKFLKKEYVIVTIYSIK